MQTSIPRVEDMPPVTADMLRRWIREAMAAGRWEEAQRMERQLRRLEPRPRVIFPSGGKGLPAFGFLGRPTSRNRGNAASFRRKGA